MRFLPALLCLLPVLSFAKHKPKPPTQPDVEQGCVAVRNIVSTKFGFTTCACIRAFVVNDCTQTVQAFVTAAYYDSSGVQFRDEISDFVIAPGTRAELIAGPSQDYEQHRFSKGVIVKLSAFLE